MEKGPKCLICQHKKCWRPIKGLPVLRTRPLRKVQVRYISKPS